MAPLAAWQQGIAKRRNPVRHPANESEFFVDFLPAVPRQIQRDGIHFYNIRYWNNTLSPWAGRLKQPLLIKYDPRNLSRVHVRDPKWTSLAGSLRRSWSAANISLGIGRSPQTIAQAGQTHPGRTGDLQEYSGTAPHVSAAVSTSRRRRQQEKTPADSATPLGTNPQNTTANDASLEIRPYPVEIWEGN
jgi:putative transposase